MAINKNEATSDFCSLENMFILSVFFKSLGRSIPGVARPDDQQGAIPGVLHHVLDDLRQGYASIPVWQRSTEDDEVKLTFSHFIDDLCLRLSDAYLAFGRYAKPLQAVFASRYESFYVLALVLGTVDTVHDGKQLCLRPHMSQQASSKQDVV